MHIRWINHPHNPSLNGTKEHVARSLAEVACGYGQAEYVQPARRGTPEWLEEMKARSAAATPPKVSWGVHRGRDTSRPAIVGRCSREVCGMIRFEGKPEDARLTVFTHSCSAIPPEKAPADVLNAYVVAVKEDQGTLSKDEADMYEFAGRKGDSGRRRQLFEGYDWSGKPIYKDPWW